MANELQFTEDYRVEDPIIESVIEKYKQRSQIGMIKYGISMRDNPLPFRLWLINLQEELLDATNYIERALQDLQK